MKRTEKLKKHLRKKYYKKDKKVIRIRIHKEEDLYNYLDTLEETLANNITEYLENTAETLLPLSKIIISVVCKEDIDTEKLKNALNLHYGLKIMNVSRYKKIELFKKIILIISSLLSVLMIVFYPNINYPVFSFIATLSIWQLTDMLLFRDEKVIIKEFIYDILEDAIVIDEKKLHNS